METERKIVLVDDKPSFRSTTKLLLRKIGGCKVTGEYNSGNEFLQDINIIDADIVFMDIEMPGINGIETTRRALKTRPDLMIIGLSLYDEPEYIKNLIEAGARGYLLKLGDNLSLIETMLKYPKAEIFYSKEIASPDVKRNVSKHRVAIVEASEGTRFITEYTLSNCGYEVYSYPDTESALKAIPSIIPDLVIADYNTIGNNFSFFKTVRAFFEASHAGLMLISSKSDENLIAEAHTFGVDNILKKPFTGNGLMAMAEKVIYE